MYEDVIEESKKLLDNLYKADNTKDIETITTQDKLRENIMTFIGGQLNSINKQDVLKALVEAELAKRILLHEISNGDLLDLFQKMSNAKTSNISAILDMFKPTNATPNSLINPPNPNENTDDDISKSLTPEERQSIHKLSLLLDKMGKKKAILKPETNEEEE